MGKVAAGRASGRKIFAKLYKCIILINLYQIDHTPGYQQLPQVSHDRAPVQIMLVLGLVKTRKREEASEEAMENVEKEMHTHKGWYLKYKNNDWKEKRAGRHDGVKECRYTVPTGNQVERE